MGQLDFSSIPRRGTETRRTAIRERGESLLWGRTLFETVQTHQINFKLEHGGNLIADQRRRAPQFESYPVIASIKRMRQAQYKNEYVV